MSGDFARTFRLVSQGGAAAGVGPPGRIGTRTGQRKTGSFVLGPRLFGDRRGDPFLARGGRSPRVRGARLRGTRRDASGKRSRGPLSPVLPWIGRQFAHGRGRRRRVFHDPAHRGGGGRGVLPTRFVRALRSPFWGSSSSTSAASASSHAKSALTLVKLVIRFVTVGAILPHTRWRNFHGTDGFAPYGLRCTLAVPPGSGIVFSARENRTRTVRHRNPRTASDSWAFSASSSC